jgi:UDP-glucuronate 4-epimerase
VKKRIFITGTAGFIGFHLAKLLLSQGYIVHGLDGLTDYYDVELKKRRHSMLLQNQNFSCSVSLLEDQSELNNIIDEFRPNVIIHLAAQAGVRYSIENPKAYIDANIIGTFHILEAAKRLEVEHLLMASTSSVYGANTDMPFYETEKADTQLTLYAATKKANESMAHAYSNLWKLPITIFRFFTVYGPWGRPDLALYKFVAAILEGRPIDIYNNGDMYRDFTYVGDLVHAISLLIRANPSSPGAVPIDGDSLSPVAPFRVVNIGNSEKIKLLDFIDAIEEKLGIEAIRNYMPMQMGDVPATWANVELLHSLTGYCPQTAYRDGIGRFIDWYREYYEV